MKEFDELLKISETLCGPEGCSWDKKQNFKTLRRYLLEETHEVLEAVDLERDDLIVEELGDLLYTIIFYTTLGKQKGTFTIQEVMQTVKEKLIRRHPHVFGGVTVKNEEEIIQNWEKIKKEEKEKKGEKAPKEFAAKTLGALCQGQKLLEKMRRDRINMPDMEVKSEEEKIAKELVDLLISEG
ncbi:MAG: MazG family protein [Simkania negevensis]|nr:MazG family protein [Simkania negevensis]